MRSFIPSLFLAATLATACDGGPAEAPPAAELAAAASTVTMDVQGMTCGGCEQAITTALLQLPGVTEAGADHQTGTAWAKVDAGGTDPASIASTVTELGYQASLAATEP